MNDRDIDRQGRKSPELSRQASLPGDPFPWEPDPNPIPESSEPGAQEDPAEAGDPSSYDLGGGD
jgi:hypothetical protein